MCWSTKGLFVRLTKEADINRSYPYQAHLRIRAHKKKGKHLSNRFQLLTVLLYTKYEYVLWINACIAFYLLQISFDI